MLASQQFSGSGDPNGVVDGNPGDLYQDQTGKAWVNTAAPSTWNQLATGGPSVFVPGAGAGSAIQNNASGNASTGVDSTVCGENNQLSGEASFAEGNLNVETIVGQGYNHLEGFQNRINCDQINAASTNHVEGSNNTLSGTGFGTAVDFNHVEGNGHNLTPSPGFTCEFNHVEGNQNSLSITSGGAISFNHVEGNGNVLLVNGGDLEFTHVEGDGNTVTSTTVDTDDSHIEGNRNNVTDADVAHIEGNENVVSIAGGTTCHVEGNRNTVGGGAQVNFCHVEGNQNTLTSTGLTNHVEGDHNAIVGTGSTNHIEGDHNTITGSATSSHVEGSNCTSTANQAHAEGSHAAAIRQTQRAKASGAFAVSGDAQTSELVFRGSTPGLAANESVELKYGDAADQFLTLENGKAYVIHVRAIGYATDTNFMSFENTFAANQEGGVITIKPAPPHAIPQVAGTAGANTWTLTADTAAAPTRISFTFATGVGTTAAVRVAAEIKFVEVAHS